MSKFLHNDADNAAVKAIAICQVFSENSQANKGKLIKEIHNKILFLCLPLQFCETFTISFFMTPRLNIKENIEVKKKLLSQATSSFPAEFSILSDS